MRQHTVFFAVALLAIGASTARAQGTLTAAPSGRGTTEVTLTLADSAARANSQPVSIRIDYGQPHLRGRQLHTGNLVPFDSIWRLGANNATTLTTGTDLVIGGANIAKGSYVLQALPSRTGWKLLIQRAGATPNTPPTDVARVDLRATTLASPVESLSIWLIPSAESGPAKGELRIAWANTQLTTNWATK